jgi:hypothetical protein
LIADPRFPNLTGFRVTSPATDDYNCIAYACGHDDRWFWPGRYWPRGFRLSSSVKVFRAVLALQGYAECADSTFEDGWEKLALYAVGDETKHAARQMATGEWTSKMGAEHDIVHPHADSLEGPEYGKVVLYMRRRRR